MAGTCVEPSRAPLSSSLAWLLLNLHIVLNQKNFFLKKSYLEFQSIKEDRKK